MNIIERIDLQRKFFTSEKTKKYEFRLRSLKNLKKAIISNENEILNALELDLSKSKYEAYMTEIAPTINEINYAIKKLKYWMKPKKKRVGITSFPGKAYEISEPYGNVLIISPWNYPFSLAFMPLVGAIAAGNTALVKPSELSMNTSFIIDKIIKEVFEEEYVSTYICGAEESEILLEEKFDYIFFTGGTNIGKIIMKHAAKHLTPVTLELGGKSPVIIEKDADIKSACRRIIFGKFLNSGQTCIAPDYILVHEDVKEDFLKNMVEEINVQLPYGYTSEYYPKIINERHFDRIISMIEDSKIFYGGRYDRTLNKIEPTILVDIEMNSKIMQEEIFGPLFPVITYFDINEAIEIVKSYEKPLALYLFTKDKNIENKVINSISFGGGCINDTISQIVDKNLHFGGVGESGMGYYHGKHTFDTFSHKKIVYKKGELIDINLRYGPYNKSISLLKKIMR